MSIMFVIVCLTAGCSTFATAQEGRAGTVTYEQITSYDFAGLFNVDMSAGGRAAEYVASLPDESRVVQKLVFNGTEALFKEDEEANKTLPPELEGALAHLDVMAPPRVILKKVYWNLEEGQTTRQIEFMTRPFHVVGPPAHYDWKLTKKQVTVQGFRCTAAETVRDGNRVTAWFTPEIPVSIGPAEYGGLPGLILAVDVNRETVFVATAVDVNSPVEKIQQPGEGKRLTQSELDALIVEKRKEWVETSGSRTNFHR